MTRRPVLTALAMGALSIGGVGIGLGSAAGATGPTPVLSSVVVPRTVTAQQGHARFLVGARISTAARLVVRIIRTSNHKVMNTVTTAGFHRAGRVFVLVQATDAQGYQLPPAAYTVFVGATGTGGRNARAHTLPLTLYYTPPRGMLDWDTIPNVAFVRASHGLHTSGGQVVVAVHPGSAIDAAGIRRGDVIESMNGVGTGSPGSFAQAVRNIPAGSAVPVVLLRGVTTVTTTLTAPPDWYPVSNLQTQMVQAAATKRFAYVAALASYDVSTGRLGAAAGIMRSWSGANGASTVAWTARAQLAVARHQQSAALTDWTGAYRADNSNSLAAFGEGLAYDALGNDRSSAEAFAVAADRDAKSAAAPAYAALALEQLHLPYLAAPFANAAVGIDPSDPNALAAHGIALIQTGRTAAGVASLEHGIDLTDDPARAQLLIGRFLEPALP